MRFRRRTIFAGLAPLIGLSALLAAASMEAGVTRPLIRLLQSRLFQSVAQLATPVSDYASAGAAHERRAPQALLAFAALAVTPLGHAVWMVARRSSIQLSARRHLLIPLRC
jgi:hypothetical protein